MATPVATVLVKSKVFEVIIRSDGKIISARDQVITAEIGGILLSCQVKTGMNISRGMVMAQMDTIQIRNKLERTKLTLFNSEKEYESQLIGFERLLNDRSVEETESIKRKLKISTGLAMAEQEIKENKYELSQCTISAPFSGVVADIQVQFGVNVKAGQELFRVYDPEDLLLDIKMLESDIILLKKGITAHVFPLSNPTKQYDAIVNTINPYVDNDGMIKVTLKIERAMSIHRGGSQVLFPGMNCAAVISVPVEHALIIPGKALVMRNGKPVVFTLESGRAKWNDVLLGRENGGEVEIRTGLKEGQKVIISNNLQLAHDAPVTELP